MSLIELAKHCHDNNTTVYDERGNGTYVTNHFRKELDHACNKLHIFYTLDDDGRLHTLGVEGNIMFCLLVNEAINGKE